MDNKTFDVVVLGGGPGGYVAALRASQLNLKVAVVESQHLGGICANWGCIPTKALLHSAELYQKMLDSEKFGISCQKVSFDFKKVVASSRQASQSSAGGVAYLLKKNQVPVFNFFGKILNKNEIGLFDKNKQVEIIKAKNIIIATGARARQLPSLPVDGKEIWSYKEAMNPPHLPKNLLVIGAGAIGMEFANFYHMLGSKVTICEQNTRILNSEDEEISALAEKIFVGQGMRIFTSSTVQKTTKDFVEIKLKDGKQLHEKFDAIIVAAGVVANIEDIGLEKVGVVLEKGFIKTNGFMQTNVENIYAIGDVTMPPWLAHKASHEGVLCAEKIAGLANLHPIDRSLIPGCIYTNPQIASVGYTEKKALDAGYKIKVGRFPYMASGKASILGKKEGLVKTIFAEKTGEFLGAHMLGHEVTELLASFILARNLEATEEEFFRTIFPHPTLSETIHESALDAYGRSLHK
jgi:dihydrolipoamide dehydrogenase